MLGAFELWVLGSFGKIQAIDMWKQCFVAATLLCASPAAAQIVTTSDSYDAFSGATYIEDYESNIVLTLQREFGLNSMNIRGLRDADGQWRVEYFCAPDTVLITEDGRRTQNYYLPYLSWTTNQYVTDDVAIVESRRVPSMGTLASLLPARVEAQIPRADITVRHQMRRGARLVESLVTITNRADHPQHMTYVYQDAAYMWFPDGDQRNTESIRLSVSSAGAQRYVNTASAGPTARGQWQFVGTFNREHGVVAGIISITPSEIAGIAGDYLGVRGVTIDGQGYYLPRDGFRSENIPNTERSGDVREMPFVNRFIAMDFGVMAPGETKTLPYFRVMAVLPPGQRTDEGIEAWAESSVRRMHQEAAERSAAAQRAQTGSFETSASQ